MLEDELRVYREVLANIPPFLNEYFSQMYHGQTLRQRLSDMLNEGNLNAFAMTVSLNQIPLDLIRQGTSDYATRRVSNRYGIPIRGKIDHTHRFDAQTGVCLEFNGVSPDMISLMVEQRSHYFQWLASHIGEYPWADISQQSYANLFETTRQGLVSIKLAKTIADLYKEGVRIARMSSEEWEKFRNCTTWSHVLYANVRLNAAKYWQQNLESAVENRLYSTKDHIKVPGKGIITAIAAFPPIRDTDRRVELIDLEGRKVTHRTLFESYSTSMQLGSTHQSILDQYQLQPLRTA